MGALCLGTPIATSAQAQDKAKAPEKKTEIKAERKKAPGRKKPTPEQIRKFNDLEKKQAK